MTDREIPDTQEKSTDNNDHDNLVDIQPHIKRRNRRVLSNYYTETNPETGKKVKLGVAGPEVFTTLQKLLGKDWPRTLNGRLFIPPNGEVQWLDKPNQLFGWISSEGVSIAWCEGVQLGVTKGEFLNVAQRSATAHTGFSKLPHFPPKAGYYYVPYDLPQNSGGAFEKLLSFFNPATPVDADILKAAFMTLFWGGPSGSKPAFVFTGLDDDKDGGRGIGKTTLTDIMSELAGGAIDFSAKLSDVEQFKKRILTSAGERVIRFDNVKTSRLSNGDIEAMITASQISGHMMYVGNGTLPNDFTYLFTFNDASFSKDMAQRAIPIKLKRPEYSGDWVEDTFNFLRDNMKEIIAGIRDCLAADPRPMDGFLRFGTWTKDVLSRAASQDDLVRKIQGLQGDMDDDEDMSQEISAIILYQMGKYRLAEYGAGNNVPSSEVKAPFVIRCSLLTQWVSEALNTRMSNRAVASLIKRSKIPGILGQRLYDGYLYWLWNSWSPSGQPSGQPSFQVASTGDPSGQSGQIPGAWRVFEDSKQDKVVSDFVKFTYR